MTTHVIIGAGPTATNAIETIREIAGGGSKIILICDEPAHSRMALPYWLAGAIPREHTLTGDNAYFQNQGVEARLGLRVNQVNPQNSSVSLSDGSTQEFDNLLIATGSAPLQPSIPGSDLPGVQPLWTLDHTQQLLDTAASTSRPRVVLVGAGFIGFIVLNAMFKRGWTLSVVERESQVLPRMLDTTAAGVVENWLGSQGVQVHTGTSVKSIGQAADGAKQVRLENGTELVADMVILATGIRSNLDLVAGSGIETDQGILVNDRLQTNFQNIYAGGDVAQGPVLFSDQNSIHAIQPTAVDHGRVAGANMAGQEVRYRGSLLMNVVDVCGLQTASFGNWNDSSAEATTISNPAGSIYRKLLWQDDRLVGAIFTGRPNDMGMLTDVGMVKGILQTQTALGSWKKYLVENPFDVRRAYIGAGVAQKLVGTTLLGRPTKSCKYRFGDAPAETKVGAAHGVFVGTKSS